MDLLFKCRRQLQLHCVISWAWFCLVLLGSSLSNSQSTLVWDTQPTSQTVETGSTVTFLCSATYESKVLQYQWKKDSEKIETDSEPRFTVRDDGTLEITNVQVLDRGSYSCFVTRKDRTKVLGESNPATLTVRGVCAAVQLVTRPSDSTFLTGTNLQFRCKCYMNPSGTFAFVKDGSAVTEDSRITIDKHKLYINNATEKDSGTYSCSATSADSSVTKKPTEDLTISVIVGKGPQFLTSPPNKSVVLEGDQLSLPCTAVGNPGPLIKWYAGFDASLLQNDSKYTIFENGTLQIKSVSKKEAKVYKCTAENIVGSIAKDTEVELGYLGDVTLEKAKLYVLINHRTEVLCGKPAGFPEPTITWEKADGEKLPDRFGVYGCCTLVKSRTKLKDSDSYTCVAKNIVGTSSKTIDIIVSERPRINIKPDNQNVKEGEPVSLDCSATSTPAAKISWTKTTGGNQEKVEKGILPNGTLLITKAQPSDSGTYRCSADHPGGWTDSAEAKVVVMCE